MNDFVNDLAWTVGGVLALLAAFAVASYSDYRTEREDECAARGMYWDQMKDKCVPRSVKQPVQGAL